MGAFLNAVAPAVIGALGSGIGTSMTNSSAMAASKKQMEFQRYMSNTAYTRAAKDLERAGLNRVLAISGPASTPSGAQPTLHDMGKSLSSGAAAGAQAGLAGAQASQAMTQAKLDSQMYKTFKNLPEFAKKIVNVMHLSERTGASPQLLLSAVGIKEAQKTQWWQYFKDPNNYGKLGQWYQSGGPKRLLEKMGTYQTNEVIPDKYAPAMRRPVPRKYWRSKDGKVSIRSD